MNINDYYDNDIIDFHLSEIHKSLSYIKAHCPNHKIIISSTNPNLTANYCAIRPNDGLR